MGLCYQSCHVLWNFSNLFQKLHDCYGNFPKILAKILKFGINFYNFCATLTEFVQIWQKLQKLLQFVIEVIFPLVGSPVLLRWCDSIAGLLANGSTAFIWKLGCHWVKDLQQHHVEPCLQQFSIVVQVSLRTADTRPQNDPGLNELNNRELMLETFCLMTNFIILCYLFVASEYHLHVVMKTSRQMKNEFCN